MDDQRRPTSIDSLIGKSNTRCTKTTVPSQVFFMDSNDIPARTNTHPLPSSYYQVATPKSPHELTLADEDIAMHHHGDGSHGTSEHDNATDMHNTIGRHDNDGNGAPNHGMGKSSRESEEMERLKYETAKSEMLDKLHLHTLISHKEVQGIQREINRMDAQMKLLEKLHEDKALLDKIEEYHETQNEKKKRQISEARAVDNSSGYFADSSSFALLPGSYSGLPLSASSNTPMHHYHTRSKSNGNVAEVPHLRPANSAIIDIRMAGSKSVPNTNVHTTSEPGFEIHPFKPTQMNLHHRRNYSSTCLTSNSGVVGKTESDEAIFRRYDGILIVITCSNCRRSGFTSAQGIVNHARLKHSKTYSSQPLAVLNNQKLLEAEKQDPQVLEKFKQLGKDPHKDYLPSEMAIPFAGRRSSQREISPKHTALKEQVGHSIGSARATKHLEKMYNKGDFNELVDMVRDASKDLEVVLKQSSSEAESSEERDDAGGAAIESEYAAASSANEESSPSNASCIKPELQIYSVPTLVKDISSGEQDTSAASPPPVAAPSFAQRKKLRKRRREQHDSNKELKERLRPAEKKARPDVLALSTMPDRDKRSTHYNLRAKSKLRGNADKSE